VREGGEKLVLSPVGLFQLLLGAQAIGDVDGDAADADRRAVPSRDGEFADDRGMQGAILGSQSLDKLPSPRISESEAIIDHEFPRGLGRQDIAVGETVDFSGILLEGPQRGIIRIDISSLEILDPRQARERSHEAGESILTDPQRLDRLGGRGLVPRDVLRRPPEESQKERDLEEGADGRAEIIIEPSQIAAHDAQPPEQEWDDENGQDEPARDNTGGIRAQKDGHESALAQTRHQSDTQSRDDRGGLPGDPGVTGHSEELVGSEPIPDDRERSDAERDHGKATGDAPAAPCARGHRHREAEDEE